jgi:hypothetical protein
MKKTITLVIVACLGLIIAAIAIMYNSTEQIIHYYPLIKDTQAS